MDRLRDSTDAIGDIEVLRSRLVADGYIFLPGYLDADRISDLQGRLRGGWASAGWITNPQALTATKGTCGSPETRSLALMRRCSAWSGFTSSPTTTACSGWHPGSLAATCSVTRRRSPASRLRQMGHGHSSVPTRIS